MKQQSELLTAFYRAYLAFAETGDNPYGFRPRNGLCSNLVKFLDITCSGEDYTVCDEMEYQFKCAGLSTIYPFNNGSGEDYDLQMKHSNAFENLQRLNWVREHAQ